MPRYYLVQCGIVKRGRCHEVKYRANTNCVTCSSSTTGLRTTHLLRSILFQALASHATPFSSIERPLSSLFCSHKSDRNQVREQNYLKSSQHAPSSQRKFPLDFSVASDAVSFTCCHVDEQLYTPIRIIYSPVYTDHSEIYGHYFRQSRFLYLQFNIRGFILHVSPSSGRVWIT